MARPKKPEHKRQTEKIVVYVTPDMKNEVMKKAGEFGLSESQLGEQAIRRHLQSLRGENHVVQYVHEKSGAMLTGPLNGTDILQHPEMVDLDNEWMDVVRFAMQSGASKEQFRAFLEAEARRRGL